MNPTDIDGRRLCERINQAAARLSELADDLAGAGWDDVAERLYVIVNDTLEIVGDIHANHRQWNG